MKKLLSMIAVVVMAMALSMTAFAAGTGSITITNATVGQTYTIYKIFDASFKTGTGGAIEGVSYSIKTDNQFFEDLFGADGTIPNTYFNYNAATGVVTKKAGVNDADLITYLSNLVNGGTFTYTAQTVADDDKEVFSGIDYGYYLITSSLDSAVTINSNTPDVEVIDKNQEPADDFDKKVADKLDPLGNPISYAEENTANIGDLVHYKVSYTATNYDGQSKIKYYSIHDTKGEGIWVEFDSFEIKLYKKVKNALGEEERLLYKELKKGYYLNHGDPSLNEHDNWEFLGDWTGVTKDRNKADWYLVHLGYDDFRITIPWLQGHELLDVTDPVEPSKVISHTLKFPDNAESKFDSPVEVEITYTATVEYNASIGGLPGGNLYNTASGTWTGEHETGTSQPDTVETKVYGLAILKDDGSTLENLAGAEFRLYTDKECTKPMYVIPTDIKGVYIVDSLNRTGEDVSGVNHLNAREKYAAYLSAYLGTNTQDNLVVTQVNGKLVILGLEKGTYYLKEVTPPPGYNALPALENPVELKVGEGTKAFNVFADAAGNVADIQETDGVHLEKTYQVTSTTVHNSKGVQLPTTGGFGRTAIIACGSLVALGFAILLITHKKMSIYTD